jgi:hypothetical protein
MNGTALTGTANLPVQPDVTWQIAGAGDFNSDGSVDILWRNASDGRNQVWYMDGVTRIGIVDLMELTELTWQIAGTGDFNQDGKIDILWRRYSDGQNMIK